MDRHTKYFKTGINFIVKSKGYGAFNSTAEIMDTSPQYLSKVVSMNSKTAGSEKKRREISDAVGHKYETVLNLGEYMVENGYEPDPAKLTPVQLSALYRILRHEDPDIEDSPVNYRYLKIAIGMVIKQQQKRFGEKTDTGEIAGLIIDSYRILSDGLAGTGEDCEKEKQHTETVI